MIENIFYHKIITRVRFQEVDMLGVCNNAVYINYFETARLEYIKAAGLMPESGIFSDGKIFFMVRNEINYRNHARYDDELGIYSRISFIKNSSFGFDHIIKNEKNNKIIVSAVKMSEKVEDAMIVRMIESSGKGCDSITLSIQNKINIRIICIFMNICIIARI